MTSLSPMIMFLEQSHVFFWKFCEDPTWLGWDINLSFKTRPGNLDNARPFCVWLLDYLHACLPRKCIFVVNILCDNVMQMQKIWDVCLVGVGDEDTQNYQILYYVASFLCFVTTFWHLSDKFYIIYRIIFQTIEEEKIKNICRLLELLLKYSFF